MCVKKTMGYVVGTQNSVACICEEPSAYQSHQVVKTGRVLTLREEGNVLRQKSADIASIANQGSDYYQVISNQGACEKCEEHNGAIYPVAEAKEGINLPLFHPNCKCTVQAYDPANPNYDPWQGEALAWQNVQNSNLSREEKIAMLSAYYGFALEGEILEQLHDINQRRHQSHEDYVNSVTWLFNRLPDLFELIIGYVTEGSQGVGDAAVNILVDSIHVPDMLDRYTATPDKNLRESTATMSFFNFNNEYKYLMKNENRANVFVQLLDERIEEIKSGSEYSAYERQVIISMLTEVRNLNANYDESSAEMHKGIEGWIRISR